jgi:phosphoglucosamine mutase
VSRVLFGTDGIRGQANLHPMTVEIALSLGQALAQLVRQNRLGRPSNRRKRIVIGKDTRLSGYCFEQAIAAGICSMGVDVMLVGPLPTPGIAFITESMLADAGIVVSASHNLFEDNGIKIFGHDGFKLPDDIELELESLILGGTLKNLRPTGELIGKAKRIDDAAGRYIVYLKTRLGNDKSLDGLRIVVDCAHGAAYKVAPNVFRELGAEVIAMNVEPDGLNINAKCGSLYPKKLQAMVLEKKAHLGIALDGDADRVVLVDEKGELVDGDAVIALLASDLYVRGELKHNTVVATEMSNLGLEKCLNDMGIKVERAQVGDRYVVERMRSIGANFGGETSGHLIFLDYGTTGDGIAAALKIIRMQFEKGLPLSELKKIFSPSARAIRNVVVKTRVPFEQLEGFTAELTRLRAQIGENGRIFVRYSGTEPKARILVESDDQAGADKMADRLTEALNLSLND